ncbi:MAG: TetR/AcrR family transcriptional regulator [Ilumatobacteraceae bacterium]
MISTRPKRGRPAMVSASEIVEAAVELIDKVGIDALTMRLLSSSMGVGPMTLYRHVADKQALLAKIPDALLADVCEDVLRKRSGIAALRTIANGVMDQLTKHPGVAKLFDDPEQGPNMEAASLHTIELLTREGMKAGEARVALRAVVAQVIGESVTRHGEPKMGGVMLLLEGIHARLTKTSG